MAVGAWYDLADRVGPELDERADEAVAADCLGLLEEAVAAALPLRRAGRHQPERRPGLLAALPPHGPDRRRARHHRVHVRDRRPALRRAAVGARDDGDDRPGARRLPARPRRRAAAGGTRAAPPGRPVRRPADARLRAAVRDGARRRLHRAARRSGPRRAVGGLRLLRETPTARRTSSRPRARASSGPSACMPEFRGLGECFAPPAPFPDAMRNLQYRDVAHTKIPRSMRFNDRVSMHASVELREPFLDHRLFELALRQPEDRKVRDGERKWLLRELGGARHPVRRAPRAEAPAADPAARVAARPARRLGGGDDRGRARHARARLVRRRARSGANGRSTARTGATTRSSRGSGSTSGWSRRPSPAAGGRDVAAPALAAAAGLA